MTAKKSQRTRNIVHSGSNVCKVINILMSADKPMRNVDVCNEMLLRYGIALNQGTTMRYLETLAINNLAKRPSSTVRGWVFNGKEKRVKND